MTVIWETSSSVSGSSGDVQVTYGTAISDNSAVALYCLITTTPTAFAGTGTLTGSAASLSQSITVPSGGGAVAIGAEYGNGYVSFTNATSDATIGSPQQMQANFGHLTSTGTISVTANASSGTQLMNLSLASWGP